MRQGRTGTVGELIANDTGLAVKWITLDNESAEISIRWDQMTSVVTYKRDEFTTDCICLAFEVAGRWYEIHEGMNGWHEAMEAIPSQLPGFPPKEEWLNEVAQPPFALNKKELWRKRTSAEQAAGHVR